MEKTVLRSLKWVIVFQFLIGDNYPFFILFFPTYGNIISEHTFLFLEGGAPLWVSQVRSRGRKYVYLSVYNKDSKRKEINVYSLGETKKAVKELEEWITFSSIPPYLINLGCDLNKVNSWLEKLKREGKVKILQ